MGELNWISVVLHDGIPFGTIRRVGDLKELIAEVELFARPMKVRVEPHHRLMAVNGNSCRYFAQIGVCILGGRKRGIIQYLDVYGGKKIALVPETHILPPKEAARSSPH